MRHLAFLLLCVLSAAGAQAGDAPSVASENAWPAPKAAFDDALLAPQFPAADVAATRFPPIAPARIEAAKFDNGAPLVKVLGIGLEREAAEATVRGQALVWHPVKGGQVARLEATSPGAVALRTAIEMSELPDGAVLRFQGSDRPYAMAADGIAKVRAEHPRLWSPVTEGDTQAIEVWLPAGADPRWVKVSVGAVSHLFASPTGDLTDAKIGESDDCEFDAKCLENPSQAILSAKQAVARMAFQKNGGTFLCTGTLLNDTDAGTQVPHLYSAAHCFTSQSIASTLTTFWFYEATGCGTGQLDASQRQVAGGAQIEFANESSDVLLVRLNNPPPSGAVYLGWNAAQVTNGTNIVVLHHPAGDVKKVSLGAIKGFGGSNLASGQFIKVGYTDGTTEGGSSGCALLVFNNGEYQLRGGLLGGTASCANTGTLSTSANSDDFSRFDLVFPSLKAFLDPAPSGGPPAGTDFTGIYNDPNQSGWGLAVLRGASGTYAVNLYHYDQDNKSAWYLSTGTIPAATYSTTLLSLTGPWFGTVPYNPAQVAVRQAGTITLQFTTATTANLTFTIDGRTVTTTVRKLSF